MTTRDTTQRRPLVRRLIAHRGRRLALATLVVTLALLASGWLAFAMTSPVSTDTASATTATTATAIPTLPPTGTPTPDTTVAPTADPTPAPTVAPTLTPTPIPTVRPTPVPPTTTTIPVPVVLQSMPLDCETAALQMGLATYGHHYSQDALFALENPDLRPVVMGPNHTIVRWGDPYANFVGNVNGSQWNAVGYGVYYPVILSIARSHGMPNAYGAQGLAASTVYRELAAGHPVEAWINSNWASGIAGTWTAFDGRVIRYSFHEHAVTLSGVSATQVRVNDPWHGTQYWVSKAAFEATWADFDNMAVVFRP